MTIINLCFFLSFLFMTVMASPISLRRHNLTHILESKGVSVETIGCKCIMSAPTKQHTDSTLCMCFNRTDGTLDDTTQCRAYTDGVFTFCTDATNTSKLWQQCVKQYCPCDGGPPTNKTSF